MYVQLDEAKYVTAWSHVPQASFIEVECDEKLASQCLLDCVQVKEGKAVVDSKRQAELVEAFSQPSVLEQVQKQLSLLVRDAAQQASRIEQLQEISAKSAQTQAYLAAQVAKLEGGEEQ
ncbi:hypothetical protein [Listeria fleischmannii]|nr:hypothetical protein [Listeria fleischmannii]